MVFLNICTSVSGLLVFFLLLFVFGERGVGLPECGVVGSVGPSAGGVELTNCKIGGGAALIMEA